MQRTMFEFLIMISTISNLTAKSELVMVGSIFLAFSLIGNKLGVKTIAKLLESILFMDEAFATSDKNLTKHVKVAACKGGSKRHADKIASILASSPPVTLQHLKNNVFV